MPSIKRDKKKGFLSTFENINTISEPIVEGKVVNNKFSLGTGTIQLLEIDISLIDVDEQVRKDFDDETIHELAKSIEQNGLLQPITVIRKEEHRYLVVMGERRLRACKKLRWARIPAIIDNALSLSDFNKRRRNQLIENIQREDLNPIEEAESIKQIMDNENITQQEVADLLGKSRTTITKTLQLLPLLEKCARAHILNIPKRNLEELARVINEPYFDDVYNKVKEGLSREEISDVILQIKNKSESNSSKHRVNKTTGITLTLDDKNEKLKLTVTWENESEKAIIEDFKRELTEVVSKKADEFRRKHESVAVRFNITTKASKPESDDGSLVLARSSSFSEYSKLASNLKKEDVLEHIKATLDVEIEKIKGYDTEFLVHQYNALPFRKPKDPSAVFFKSVTNNWTLPPKYIKEKINKENDHRSDVSYKETEIQKLENKLEKYNEFIKETDKIQLDTPSLKMRENMIKEIPAINESIKLLSS